MESDENSVLLVIPQLTSENEVMSKDYGQFCGLAKAAWVLGERWALVIVRDLSIGPRRFKDLHQGLPGIPTSVLTARLRELETAGVAERQIAESPQRGVVYQLTEYGHQLQPIIDALGLWGAQRMSSPAPDDIVTNASLAAALRSAYQHGTLGTQVTYLVHAGTASAWAQADSSSITVSTQTPDFSPDVTIHAGPEIRLLLAGSMSAAEALQLGVIEVDGPADSLATFCRAFHVPLDPELISNSS